MSRLIIIVGLFIAGYFLLKRSIAPSRRGRGEGPPQSAAPDKHSNIPGSDREDMVFDEMCKSYISKSGALSIERGGEVHYFCGGACRQMFINSNQAGPY